MMCLPRSASASCSCVIRPESSLTADCTRFAASSCNRARSEASRCHPPPIPLCRLPQSITSLRQARPHEPRVSFDKIKREFDQDRQIRGVRISVHVYLTDKRAAAQVVYVAMRCGIELDEPRNIWGASLPPDDWNETAGLETGH